MVAIMQDQHTQKSVKQSSSKVQDKIWPNQAHHIVLGAGLVGCYIGASFAYAKQTVSLITRQKTANQLQHHFSISDYKHHTFKVSNDFPVFIHSNSLEISQKADFLWLTVKCLSIQDALDDIRHCIGDDTIILCCQNGVSNHLEVRQAFPRNNVIRAMVPFNVDSDGKGNFHRGSQGHMVLESIPDVTESVRWLARQVSSKHLPVDISFDMTALQWAKLQLNLGNAVNALADIPVKKMLETKEYRILLANMMRELLAVTRKKQIKLPKIANLPNTWIPFVLLLPNILFQVVAQQMLAIDPSVRTSMWWDVQQGKLTEIDYLNGKVVEQGEALGVSTPLNGFIVKVIKATEAGNKPTAEAFLQQVININKSV